MFNEPIYSALFIGEDGWQRMITNRCPGCLRKLVLAAEKLGRIRMSRMASDDKFDYLMWKTVPIRRIVAHYGKYNDQMADPTYYLVTDCRPDFRQL